VPLTFPPAVVEQAVNDPVTTYTRRCNIFEADNTTLFRGSVPMVNVGNVTIDMGASTRRNAELALINEGGSIDIDRNNGLWYDKVIKIYMGVEIGGVSWEQPIGSFLIDRIKSSGLSQEVRFTLRDFSKKLSFNVPYALEWPIATPVENIIQTLASGGGVGPAQTNLPLTGANTTSIHTVNNGTLRWKAMSDLAIAFGYDLFFDEHGVLQMETFTDPSVSAPQYVFRTGQFSNVAKIDREIADDLIRNHIVVKGEQADGTPVWGEAENNNATSPTRIAVLGRRTREYDSSWVVSNTQAVEVAERFLKVQSLERYETQLSTITIPWMDVNETVEFDDPRKAVGDPTRYLLNRVSIPLDLSAASARLGRVTSVL